MKTYNNFIINELFSFGKKKEEIITHPVNTKQLEIPKITKYSRNIINGLDVFYVDKKGIHKGVVTVGDKFTTHIKRNNKTHIVPSGSVYVLIPSNIEVKKKLKKLIEFLFIFDLKVNFLDFGSEKDKISYLPKNRFEIVSDKGLDPWNNNYRQEIKIGRFVRNLVNDKVKSSEVERFVNIYKATFDVLNGQSNLQVVEGEDIRHWYNGKNYKDSNNGSLPHSCMKYKSYQKVLKLYSKNPQVCKLLIKVDEDNKLLARALIWKTNKGTYLDRVYYIDDNDQNLFELYAKKRDWKFYSECDDNMKVKLKWVKGKDDEDFPYMDTFSFLNLKNSTITNDDYSDYDVELDCG